MKKYTTRQLIEMDACTSCRICADVCPAVSASADGRLSGMYRLDRLKHLMKKRGGLLARLLKRPKPSSDELKEFSNTVFNCTLCSACQEACPAGIRLKDLWCDLRQDLVEEGAYPPKINMIRDNLADSRNVFGEDNEERADWVEDMRDAPEEGLVLDHAKVVYFVGCTSAFFPLAQKIPMAAVEIFQKAGVDFTLLGEDEWCCGFPLIGAGLKDDFREFVEHNIEAIRSKGADTVVFACPSCYQMWREHYPDVFKIYHATEFILKQIQAGKLNLKPLNMTVTYHDPCDLGRGAHVYETPRRLIAALPGVTLVELPGNRENCLCCGGGGNLEMMDPALSAAITGKKMEEVQKTGARAVVTSCQQCVRTMTTYVRRNNLDIEVLDVIQLVQKALDT